MEQRAIAIRELLKKEAERQERYREKLTAKTEEFRANDDPQRRAERYLACALECEREGDWKAAMAYYRLIMRMLPNGDTATEARDRLELLAGK